MSMNFYAILVLLLLVSPCSDDKQPDHVDQQKVLEDLDFLLSTIEDDYIYYDDKNIDLLCLKTKYSTQINDLVQQRDVVLFFENLMNEFSDSHLILNANTNESYRLYAPIYASIINEKAIVTQIWHSQIGQLEDNIIGAEILSMNDINIQRAIDNFPTFCDNKELPKTREWVLNKVLSGKRNIPRQLSVRLTNGKETFVDLDAINIRAEEGTLSAKRVEDVGVIRLNNSLGDKSLVSDFENTLESLKDTRGLILDLRNTIDGGNTNVAKPLMRRFIKARTAFQKHRDKEKTWFDYVRPKGWTYDQPIVVLVGRWTGSMGEGVAIGLDGMSRATIVGTEMTRLAGAMQGFPFKHRGYEFRLSVVSLFHVNGQPREEFVPVQYVQQAEVHQDEIYNTGMALLQSLINHGE